MRFLTGTPPDQYQQAVRLLEAVEQGTDQVVTSSPVIFETIFVVHRTYRVPMPQIRDALLPIINLPNLQLAHKALYSQAFDLSIHLNIPLVDAYSAAFMEANGISEVYTFDRHFDRIEGIARIEPGAASAD